MKRDGAILTEEICDAIISEVYDSKEYQSASGYLEEEIMALLGEDELKWAKRNDTYAML